ncbi:AbrB/MazE/SpoVT family DNA-binding domain-containing protein [Methylobacter sp.]|uniref:AbrB/MazE/SpoVT family DNA-binding domain-containing protein n=1 Tax=Methylobacter sp. TaxID=2051955 RepID=UPI0025E8F0BF|nr:AbrB/MazE/SpoVT family DNA-binding domain-containing protein [Methylobacter sp.]
MIIQFKLAAHVLNVTAQSGNVHVARFSVLATTSIMLSIFLAAQRSIRPAVSWIYNKYPYIFYTWESVMQVEKWGNSLAVRLPASVVEALQLKEGDDIEIHIAGERVFELEKKPSPQELLARLRKYRGRLPADFKFDRLEAHENR